MTLDIPLSKRNIIQRGISQLTFTCSKSAIETLEKGLKYVQSLQQKHSNNFTEIFPRTKYVNLMI